MTTAGSLAASVLTRRRSTRPPSDRLLLASGTVLVLIVLFALIGPLISRYPADAVDILSADRGPSPDHWLGTDALGRDLFARLAAGARLSLLGAAAATVVATVAGTVLAVVGAWRGGRLDQLLSRGLDVAFAFPGLLFAILAVTLLGPGLLAPVIALSLAYIPYVARLLRSVALRQRHLPYIESCQLQGFSTWRTTTRHLVPNIRLFVTAQATLTFGYALLDLAAVSFIGLGVQPPDAEWGLMVSDGASSLLNGQPWEVLFAGLAIVITVVGVNVVGERLSARAEELS